MTSLLKLVLLPALLALAKAEFPFDVDELQFATRNDDGTLGYRLPEDFDPLHFEVEITPYFEEAPAGSEPFTFDGRVTMTIQVSFKKFHVESGSNVSFLYVI